MTSINKQTDIYTTADKPVQLHVFHAHMPSVKYVFRDGSFAEFVHGKYYTDNPNKIKEIQEEVALRHPVIFIKPGEETIMSDDLDPMNVVRKNLRKEIMLEMLRAIDPTRDFGEYEQGKLNAMSTSDIAAVVAGGETAQNQAALKAMLEKEILGTKDTPGVDVSKVAPGIKVGAKLTNIPSTK